MFTKALIFAACLVLLASAQHRVPEPQPSYVPPPVGKRRSEHEARADQWGSSKAYQVLERQFNALIHPTLMKKQYRTRGEISPVDRACFIRECVVLVQRFDSSVFNPSTTKSDEFEISPVASAEILHHTI